MTDTTPTPDDALREVIEALDPCPFCGGIASFRPYKRDGLTLRCETFGCVSFNGRTLRYSIDWLRSRMTKRWNTRVYADRIRLALQTLARMEAAPSVKVRGKVGELATICVSHDFVGKRVRLVLEESGI